MTKVRVGGFSISPTVSEPGLSKVLKIPLGKRGLELHQWIFGTHMFLAMTGKGGGSDGLSFGIAVPCHEQTYGALMVGIIARE